MYSTRLNDLIEGVKTRNKATLNEARGCWDLGKFWGIYVIGKDSDGTNILEDMEKCDWDEFKRR